MSSLKLDLIRCVAGFSDSESKNNSYISTGITNRRGGMIPYWDAVKQTDSTAVATIGLMKWFDQATSGGLDYVFGMNGDGSIFAAPLSAPTAWAISHTQGTIAAYTQTNGMITDQKGRLLYYQRQYIGMFTGGVWTDKWKDTGITTDIDIPADTYEDWVVSGHENSVYLLNVLDSSGVVGLDFPSGFKIKSIRSGRTGVLLGFNFGPKSMLALWDCRASGSIAPWIWLGSNIKSICKYQGQWIVCAGNEYFITNGYTKTPLARPPDWQIGSDAVIVPSKISGMMVKDNYLIVLPSCGDNAGIRLKSGIWIYDLVNKIWEICPVSNYHLYGVTPGAIFTYQNSSAFGTLFSYSTTLGGTTSYFIDKLRFDTPERAMYVSPLLGDGNAVKTAEGLTLNVNYNFEYDTRANTNGKITAAIYDYSKQFWGNMVTNLASTAATELRIDGTAIAPEVGDMVWILEGINAGLVGFVKSITNDGLATEKLVLDRSLEGGFTENNVRISHIPARHIGDWDITGQELRDHFFPIKKSIQGKKFMIILHFLNTKFLMVDKLGLLYSDHGYY